MQEMHRSRRNLSTQTLMCKYLQSTPKRPHLSLYECGV